MSSRPGVVDARRALEPCPLQLRRSLHHAGQSGRQRDAHLLQHESRLPACVWHAADNLNAYFSYGQGFETPTFAELAYNPVGPGLNFDLNPATSTAYELGLKWLPLPTQRVNLAVFTAKTKEEIVVNTATGGRTTYANAGTHAAPWRRGGVGRRPWLRRSPRTRTTRICSRNSPTPTPPARRPSSCLRARAFPACRRSRPTAC